LSARGTSTLLNNALLSAHFLFADDPGAEQVSITIKPIAVVDRSTQFAPAPAFIEVGFGHLRATLSRSIPGS
jgi:hypothetical protein